MGRIPATGWYVEVDNADTGHTWTPSVVGDPEWLPDLLPGLPRIEIPVPRDAKWDADWADEAPMRAWYDGQQLPIEELEKTRQTPGETILVGIGGVELREPIRKEYGRGNEIHQAAESILTSETSYSANVDDPETTAFPDETILDVQTTADFERELSSDIADDEPFAARNGGIELLQSAFLGEAEDNIQSVAGQTISDSDASQTQAVELEFNGDELLLTFENEYDWASAIFQIRRRGPSGGGTLPEISFIVDTVTVGSIGPTTVNDDSYAYVGVADTNGLDAGSHTLQVRVTNTDGVDSPAITDLIYVRDIDKLTNINQDDTVDADGNLAGPELYIESDTRQFNETETLHAVDVVDFASISIDDTSNNQSIGISTDGGATWDTQSNTATHTGLDPPGTVVSIRPRLTLSRYDDGRDATPTQGNSGQRVESLTIQADLEDMPYVFNDSFHDAARNVLGTLANRGDFVAEVTHDGSGIAVAWTRSGQRSADREANVTDYEFERSTENLVQEATVKGASQFRYDERFDADHGTAVALDRDELLVGSEEVSDPSFGGTTYERGSDYEMDYANGEITVLAGGDMADSTEFSIDYRWRIAADYDDGTASPRSIVRTVPELTTQRACSQAAYTIVDELNTPTRPTQVVLPSVEPGWSLIEELDLEQLPAGIPLQIRGIQPTPAQTVVRLDTRQAVGDVISDIQERVEGLARSV